MLNDLSAAQNVVRAAEIKNDPPLPSQRDNDTYVLVVPYKTQQEVTI